MSVADIRNGLSLKLSQLIMMSTLVFGAFGVAFYVEWSLALVSSASVVFLPGTLYLTMSIIAKTSKIAQKSYGDAGGVAEEAITGIRTISSLNAQEYFVNWYDQYIDKASKSMKKFGIISAATLSSMDAVINLAAAIGFWYAGKILLDAMRNPFSGLPEFTIGNTITVIFSAIAAGFAIGQSSSSLGSVLQGFNALVFLKETIERPSNIDPLDESGIMNTDIRGDIEFHNVSFYFPNRPDAWIFRNLSFKILGGTSVAFVGPSGIGKSTIIQLIQRFYDPVEGYITLDGIPLKDYNLHWLRKSYGCVSQNPRLFSFSIKENIEMGKIGQVEESDIVEAAKSALANEFITKLPEGYQTEAGEGGNQLSGGQKQRIAIARALISHPPILLFDEATSALDTISEKLVQHTLDKLITEKNHTSILVAHRLSTIRNSDQIFVLNSSSSSNMGAYIEQVGTNNELMTDPNGLFYKLMNSQDFECSTSSGSTNKTEFSIFPFTQLADPHYSDELEDKIDGEKKTIFHNLKTKLNKKKSLDEFTYPKFPAYKLFRFMTKDSVYLAIGFVASFLGGFVYPGFAIIVTQFLYDATSFNIERIETSVTVLPIMIGSLAVYSFLTSFLQFWAFNMAGENLVRTLRHKTFVSLLNQEMEFYDKSENSPGQLTSILSSDTQVIQGSAGLTFGVFFKSTITVIFGLSIAFFTNAKIAAMSLLFTLFMLPGHYVEHKFLIGDSTGKNISDKSSEAKNQSSSAVLSEIISQIRTVASFGLEKKMYKRYEESLEGVNELRNALIAGGAWGYSQGSHFFVNAAIFWYGGWLVNRNEADSLQVFRVIFVLMFVTLGASQAGLFTGDQKKAALARSRVFGIINRPSKINPSSTEGKKHTFDDVQMDNLEFSYAERPDIQVLNKLSLNIEAGKTYAIVGESGCGKSTIIQLMERFYDTNNRGAVLDMRKMITHQNSGGEGGLYYTGERIDELNVKHMRSQIGLVSQEPILFNTSIIENIRIAKPNATIEEVINAAKIANAHTFINNLPDKYETKVGRMGELLSGGQKQRIVIARSIIDSPSILLFDEATSALDNESEKIVQSALDDLMAHHPFTTVIIAHRLSTIKDADKIVVLKASANLEGSSVCEIGTHNQLLAKRGEYFKLYNSQYNELQLS